MIACPGPETLALLLQEQLKPPLREQIEAHIEGCEACQQELDRLSREATPLQVARPERAPAPGGFVASSSFLARIGNRGAFHLPPSAPGADWPRIDGYEILGELGSGGMGRVYRARHLGLGRRVALKVIRPGPSAELLRGRLEQEAMALARLRHPNIVQVHDIGISDGQAYLSLELIEGTTLAAWLNGTPQPPDVAAHLAWVLAQGVDYAHRNGILHRDLKPANVLVESHPDESPDPEAKAAPPRIKITDFGLAKAIAEGDPLAAALTMTGDVLGTPQYMAPEQGSGLRGPIGPGADIYALGVILYELLTGRPPFRGETPLKTILQVVHEAPPSLSRFRPRIPADLDTICMKCLEKSPSRRYHSAGALAEDLRRFLAHEPIAARPVGAAGRLARWARRKPWLAATAGAAAAGAALAFGLVFWQWRAAEAARLESEWLVTGLLVDEHLANCENGAPAAALDELDQARRRAEGLGLPSLAEVCRANIACWSSRKKIVSTSPRLGTIIAVASSPDGRRILAVHRPDAGDGGGEGPGRAVATLWDPEGWKAIGRPLEHEGSVACCAFSPDGRLALTGAIDGGVRLWDAVTGEPAGPVLRELKSVSVVAFHPGGKLFAAGGERLLPGDRGRLCFWEVGGGDKLSASYPFTGPMDAIAFSPDGKLIATASRMPGTSYESANAEIFQWDVETMGRMGPELIHSTVVRALAYSPNSKLLATGGDDQIVILWDRETGGRVRSPIGNPAAIKSLAFMPGGKTMIIVGGEVAPGEGGRAAERRASDAKFWDVETGKPHAPLFPQDTTRAIALGAGKRMAVADWDGRIRMVDIDLNAASKRELTFACSSLEFGPAGGPLIAAGARRGSAGGATQALDPATGEPLRPPVLHPSKVAAVAISRGGDAYAVALEGGPVLAFDASTDRPLGEPLEHPGAAKSLAFSWDGGRLLATVPGSTARLWDWRSGELVWSSPEGDAPRAAALSPDGRRVLATKGDEGLRLWDVAGGPPRELWTGPPARFVCVDFSADGRLALAGDDEAMARCWELATGHAHEVRMKFGDFRLSEIRFVGEGSGTYAISSYPAPGVGHAYAWDPPAGRPPKQLRYRADHRAVAFDPEQRFIALGGWIGGASLWDAATGHRIGPELFSPRNVVAIACAPGGRSVAAIDDAGTLNVWRIPLPGPEPPAK